MNWREWTYNKLTTTPITGVVDPANVYAGGALNESAPPREFPVIVYRMGSVAPLIRDAEEAIAEQLTLDVWVYDGPGSYDRIDSVLALLRSSLSGQVLQAGACACRWEGDSGELADDALKAITRFATFRLIGATS